MNTILNSNLFKMTLNRHFEGRHWNTRMAEKENGCGILVQINKQIIKKNYNYNCLQPLLIIVLFDLLF